MKNRLLTAIFLISLGVSFFALSLTNPPPVSAAECTYRLSTNQIAPDESLTITVNGDPGSRYRIRLRPGTNLTEDITIGENGSASYVVNLEDWFNNTPGQFTVLVDGCNPSGSNEVDVGESSTGSGSCTVSTQSVEVGKKIIVRGDNLTEGVAYSIQLNGPNSTTPLGILEEGRTPMRNRLFWSSEVEVPSSTSGGNYTVRISSSEGVVICGFLTVQGSSEGDGDEEGDGDDDTDCTGEESEGDECPPDLESSVGILSRLQDPLQGKFTNLGQIVSATFTSILLLGGVLAFLFIIWGGFKYMTAQGDPKAIGSARGTIVSAIIGLVLLASVFAILFLVEFVFQIQVLGSLINSVYAR